MTQDDFNEAVLAVTGGPNWSIVKKGLANDIYAAQTQALEATSWEQVNELRGFAKGLAFVMNLRESVLLAKDQGQDFSSPDIPRDAFL